MKIEKINRKIMYFMLAAIMCLSVAAVGVFFSKANAQTEITAAQFKLKGASVRYVTEDYGAGVKFHVLLDKTVYESLSDTAKTGVKICPKSLLGDEDIKTSANENIIDKEVKKAGWFDSVTDADMKELVVYVYDIDAKYYGTDLAVVGYVSDGETSAYTETGVTSFAKVAKTAAASETDETKKEQLKGYYTFEVKLYNADKTLKESKTVEYGEVLTKPEDDVCGWYNKDLSAEWNFETDTVKGNVSLYAKAHGGEFTYTANNDGTHKKVYACCGTVAAENEECSGGTATCMKKAECEHCGAAYGELSTEHVWATEWSHDETNHWYACTVEGCIAKKDEAAHLGGTATCKTKAVCEVCGGEYGELNAENHESAEFTYIANNDGTHKKAHECCDAVENANETCSGGTATCVAKAVCALCGEEYGALSSKHAYAGGLDTSDDEYDYKKCICGELDLENGFRKIVNADNQQLAMTSETIALNLEGVSAYDAVKSITLGEANLGTNVNALELGSIKTDAKQHGAKVIKIVVTDADGLDHEIIVNVTLVTQVISTDAELKVAFREKSLVTSEDRIDLYGYYVLANDIVYTGNRNYINFRGTFDGNGKTIATSEMLNGLFAYAWDGCVIKDLTIKATISPMDYNFKTILANGSLNATFINVGVIYEGGADSSELNDGGLLFRGENTNSKFINLTVSATGKKIGSLFGQKLTNTTFTDCVVYADEVNCVAGMADGTNRVEFADVEGLEHKQIEVKEIALWQETPSLDYGDMFDGKTVAEITCGNYSLGNSLTALSIPEGLKADKQNHGSTVICVKFASGAKAYLPVILVTGEIKTESDFVGALTITSTDDAVKYGYYKLADNLVFGHNVNGTGSFWDPEASAELGFRGTFDGNGYTVSTADGIKVYNGGFFGIIGKGAVIKNVTFTVTVANALGVFGSQGHNATIQDVTINFKANGAPTNTTGGVFFARFSGTITYKNVTVNAAGQDLQTIFGNTLGSNVPNCENVVVNAKSLVAIGYGSYNGAPITTLKDFTFNKTETLE